MHEGLFLGQTGSAFGHGWSGNRPIGGVILRFKGSQDTCAWKGLWAQILGFREPSGLVPLSTRHSLSPNRRGEFG